MISNSAIFQNSIKLTLGCSLFLTNLAFAKDIFIDRIIGPNYTDLPQPDDYKVDDKWPKPIWPNDIWWVPLEYDQTQKDVIQAVITPVTSPEGWEGYEITTGTKRRDITEDEFNLAAAVGRLGYRPKTGIQWTCTATHVGNGYVVTAGHCLPDPKTTNDACSALQVEWDYRKSRQDFIHAEPATLVGKCQKIISWQFKAGDANTIDHAIFQVDQAPDAFVKIAAKPNLEDGDFVHQLSHPGGAKLIWSESCKITTNIFQYYQHDCWGASGSSGSALIDVKTNTLIGVLSMGKDSTHFSVRNDVSPIGCFNTDTGQVNSPC